MFADMDKEYRALIAIVAMHWQGMNISYCIDPQPMNILVDGSGATNLSIQSTLFKLCPYGPIWIKLYD